MSQPPPRLSYHDLWDWSMAYLKAHFDQLGTKCHCKQCGNLALTQILAVSFHTVEFEGCVGSGHVENPFVPVCTTCEPDAPSVIYTCVHDPMLHPLNVVIL
jgi:hypothetical protein